MAFVRTLPKLSKTCHRLIMDYGLWIMEPENTQPPFQISGYMASPFHAAGLIRLTGNCAHDL